MIEHNEAIIRLFAEAIRSARREIDGPVAVRPCRNCRQFFVYGQVGRSHTSECCSDRCARKHAEILRRQRWEGSPYE